MKEASERSGGKGVKGRKEAAYLAKNKSWEAQRRKDITKKEGVGSGCQERKTQRKWVAPKGRRSSYSLVSRKNFCFEGEQK